ncbi:MAG: hypothetical protein ACYTGQ_05495 [Planctomycetota bacterium]
MTHRKPRTSLSRLAAGALIALTCGLASIAAGHHGPADRSHQLIPDHEKLYLVLIGATPTTPATPDASWLDRADTTAHAATPIPLPGAATMGMLLIAGFSAFYRPKPKHHGRRRRSSPI